MELKPQPTPPVLEVLNTEVLDPQPVCRHVYPKGRHCRQAVASPDHTYCAIHSHRPVAPSPAHDPFAELARELGAATEIDQVRKFIAKVIQLACQNRIGIRRATALTFMANSLLNAIRLSLHEERLRARAHPEELQIDWTGFPCPERDPESFRGPAPAPPG